MPSVVSTTSEGGGTQDVNIVGPSPLPIAIDQTGDNNDVDVTNGAGVAAVNIQDGGNSITVDGTVSVSNFPATQPVSGVGNFTVVQPTGTNLHSVLDSGTLTGALPAGTNVIGHVIADSGSTTAVTGNVTVVQSTGTNLHTTVDNFPATQPISGTVAVSNFPATQPVSGTVTANAGTNLNTSALALDATLTNATQKTKLVDTGGTNVASIDATGDVQVDVNNFPATQAISAASLPLPTGASTSALQTQPGVDIGDVTINNASGGSAVNIQDGGNSITVDGTVTATLGTSSLANGAQTSVSSSAVQVLAANANRKSAIVQNVGLANVRVGITGVTATTGVLLVPNGSISFKMPNVETNAFFAIRDGSVDSTIFAFESV